MLCVCVFVVSSVLAVKKMITRLVGACHSVVDSSHSVHFDYSLTSLATAGVACLLIAVSLGVVVVSLIIVCLHRELCLESDSSHSRRVLRKAFRVSEDVRSPAERERGNRALSLPRCAAETYPHKQDAESRWYI